MATLAAASARNDHCCTSGVVELCLWILALRMYLRKLRMSLPSLTGIDAKCLSMAETSSPLFNVCPVARLYFLRYFLSVLIWSVANSTCNHEEDWRARAQSGVSQHAATNAQLHITMHAAKETVN